MFISVVWFGVTSFLEFKLLRSHSILLFWKSRGNQRLSMFTEARWKSIHSWLHPTVLIRCFANFLSFLIWFILIVLPFVRSQLKPLSCGTTKSKPWRPLTPSSPPQCSWPPSSLRCSSQVFRCTELTCCGSTRCQLRLPRSVSPSSGCSASHRPLRSTHWDTR